MRRAVLGLCALSLFAVRHDVARARGDGPVRVNATVPSQEYVLGAPVFLVVRVTNMSEQPTPAWVDLLSDRVQIMISRADGDAFVFMPAGREQVFDIAQPVEPLQPGQTKRYEFRILYTSRYHKDPQYRSRLAFDRPGRYSIKVRYPLYPKGEIFESNVTEITIREPKEGREADLWREIQRPENLCFVQSGRVIDRDDFLPMRVLSMFRRSEETGYHDGLKAALRDYYADRRLRLSQWQSDLDQIRMALGIPEDKEPEGPFLEDRRLDIRVRYEFREMTPLAEVLAELSRQSKVPLRLAPALSVRRMKCGEHFHPLREFMDRADSYKATWVRDDNGGYRLVPADDPK